MINRLYVFVGIRHVSIWIWVLDTFIKIAKLYIISCFSSIIEIYEYNLCLLSVKLFKYFILIFKNRMDLCIICILFIFTSNIHMEADLV